MADEADATRWHAAQVLELTEHAVKVSLLGWCAEWAEWMPLPSPRIRAATGDAAAATRRRYLKTTYLCSKEPMLARLGRFRCGAIM